MRYVQQRWAKQGRLTSPGSRQVQLRLSLSNKGSYGHTMLYLAVTYLYALRLLGCLQVPSGESGCTSPSFLLCSYARAAAGFPCWGKQKWPCADSHGRVEPCLVWKFHQNEQTGCWSSTRSLSPVLLVGKVELVVWRGGGDQGDQQELCV